MTSLSILFPCYNEEANLPGMLEEAVKLGEQYGVDYEVIVVDDGSADRSAAIVQEWTRKNPRVRLVQHSKNEGYGAALGTALRSAAKDLVFLTDGDRQFQLSDIEKLFAKIDSCDAVTGYRLARQDGFYRRLNGRLWTGLVKLLFGLPVRDVDCAFKLFRRRALEGLEFHSRYLLVHAEILARLKKRGCRIEEVGVPHYPRPAGEATATKFSSVLKTFVELFKLYWRIR
ncbi:MAG: glycosyltransferase family 2 protein [Candidatus Omnitrophica bacterium]|nr:glycosyltransferase family 2 protein [Candidatus Omnitrophota bacterium]